MERRDNISILELNIFIFGIFYLFLLSFNSCFLLVLILYIFITIVLLTFFVYSNKFYLIVFSNLLFVYFISFYNFIIIVYFLFISSIFLLSFYFILFLFIYKDKKILLIKCNNKGFSYLLINLLFYSIYYTFLFIIIFCSILFLINYLFSLIINVFIFNRIFVIFYFLKYNFIWLSTIFWFRIAITGIAIFYFILFVLLLGEIDPFYKVKANQVLFWFYNYNDLEMMTIKYYMFYPFNLIRDSFTVSYHFDFDIHIIVKYGILLNILFIFKFLLSSFVSVWMYDIFWTVWDFNPLVLSDSYNYITRFFTTYILVLIIIMNIFTALSSIFFFVFISAFIIEAVFIYYFNLPFGGCLDLEFQVCDMEGHMLALSPFSIPYYYSSFSLSNIYLKMLPQPLSIRFIKSCLVLSIDSFLNNKYYSFYVFIIKDLCMFFIDNNLFSIYLEIFEVVNSIVSIRNNYHYVVEYLLIVKLVVIFNDIYKLKKLINILNNSEVLYLDNISSDYYNCLFKRFNIKFNNNIFNSNIRLGFSIALMFYDSDLFKFTIIDCKEYNLKFNYKLCFNRYDFTIYDLITLNIDYFYKLYNVLDFISRDVVSSSIVSRSYISYSINLKIMLDYDYNYEILTYDDRVFVCEGINVNNSLKVIKLKVNINK